MNLAEYNQARWAINRMECQQMLCEDDPSMSDSLGVSIAVAKADVARQCETFQTECQERGFEGLYGFSSTGEKTNG